uniref:Longin domain-containing protein n=1 Tax=Steinernema glaseri TaxID=37863 RepID=A0A1I7Y0S1_9BILA
MMFFVHSYVRIKMTCAYTAVGSYSAYVDSTIRRPVYELLQLIELLFVDCCRGTVVLNPRIHGPRRAQYDESTTP